ncbi:hypothetical protein VF14_09050 [Nostoc linckia z18]|uniref:Uncharacterized protein n=3 Tax=Nostoc linckia TaxID=92942 RepID=A0A9Q5ZEL3_NOSLI|nr:hypothetical protein VF02_24675 [Nostoc linckia z1]PHJ65115.1 hypothetical protein VF05_21475 [Nostoc linckia z3]PHJ69612.1 hypothetical protein VF03_23755 [Nostoc linckia z2]PHJ83656.1 hypothetical protein VF06_12470 [Nostoc linckia z4]PHJ86309.1 hypothetical protein VF07_22400 [Nostoc linckia z6]PHJ96246.1 hypothetical protein VF04_16250 [Nostoc linckia z7]PHK05375.1 hypothetical protein VF08_08355 [Nostoc linckia z8]PHK12411.1 hypothetical protein VF09_03115 [Nostoc linckia z9]PHK1610
MKLAGQSKGLTLNYLVRGVKAIARDMATHQREPAIVCAIASQGKVAETVMRVATEGCNVRSDG